MMAIFSYGFPTAVDNFLKAKCQLDTLSNYETLIQVAAETGYVTPNDLETLKVWRKSPDKWNVE
jgi:orotate phosphoribosyltransferase